MPDRRRWGGDARGVGVADARGWTPVVDSLARLATESGWVAEEPELHLLPHLEAAAAGTPLRVETTRTDPDGTFVVDLRWVGDGEPSRAAIRTALFALVASMAETITLLHEPPDAGGRVLEVLTGSADSGTFAGHGHTLRLALSTPAGLAPATATPVAQTSEA